MFSSPVAELRGRKRSADSLDSASVKDSKRRRFGSPSSPTTSMILEALEKQTRQQAEHSAKIEQFMEQSEKNTKELLNVLKLVAVQIKQPSHQDPEA